MRYFIHVEGDTYYAGSLEQAKAACKFLIGPGGQRPTISQVADKDLKKALRAFMR